MKKAIALLLVMITILSLSTTAFAAKSEKKPETVYVTSSGNVYHESDCPDTWNGRYRTTLKEAHKNKLKPCPDCSPAEYDKEDLEGQEEYVYVLMGKTVYHNPDCKTLWTEENWSGTSMTLKKAQTDGLRACGLCDPDSGTQKSKVYQVSETGSYHTCSCTVIWKSRFKTTLDDLPENARPCKYCHEGE